MTGVLNLLKIREKEGNFDLNVQINLNHAEHLQHHVRQL